MKKLLLTAVMLLSAGQIFSANTGSTGSLMKEALKSSGPASVTPDLDNIIYIGDKDPDRHSRRYDKGSKIVRDPKTGAWKRVYQTEDMG